MLASSYALIYYTDYTEIIADYEDYRYNVGWIVIGLIMFAIIWNVAKIFRKTITTQSAKMKHKIANDRKWNYKYFGHMLSTHFFLLN